MAAIVDGSDPYLNLRFWSPCRYRRLAPEGGPSWVGVETWNASMTNGLNPNGCRLRMNHAVHDLAIGLHPK
jgi:hypothetical protein